MTSIGQIERATQNRVVKLFREQLQYDYLGNWEERLNNRNIEETYLRAEVLTDRIFDIVRHQKDYKEM